MTSPEDGIGRGTAPILAGLQIVEVAAFIATPLCGLTLAQLGAEVIRVDLPGGNIDIDRLPLAPSGRSLYWASLNRGKRSVEIDFRTPKGARAVQQLLARSGSTGAILVTNLPLDGELGYERLREIRPDLIMVRLSGSPDGRSEMDYTVNCAVGLPLVTGPRGHAPVNHVLPAWDVIAGLTLANGLLAAELHRRATGRGQLVELSLSDVAMATVSNLGYLAESQILPIEREADGNYLFGAYGDAFRTADGRQVMVAAITDRQWRALIDATGLGPAVTTAAHASSLELATAGGRYEARELISASLRPWFADRTFEEVARALDSRGVLWGVYRTFRQMLREDPRCSEHNPMFRRVDHRDIGELLTAASPLAFSAAARVPPKDAPMLGEHSAEVLRDLGSLPEE